MPSFRLRTVLAGVTFLTGAEKFVGSEDLLFPATSEAPWDEKLSNTEV